MYTDPEVERQRTVVNTPGGYKETVTETQTDSGISGTMIATIAIIALLAIGIAYYVVSNKNANEEANRQTTLEASRNQQPATVTQPAPQQPLIIQQPAQQAPVVIQQPPQSAQPVAQASSPLDDTTIQDAATKRLLDDPSLASISVMVISGRATLMGTVNSVDLKRAAERVVKSVQGVKSVDNKIEISKQ